MGHAIQMLTFPVDTDKKKIERQCTEWGNHNCDPWEHGGQFNCGGIVPQYLDKTFDSYDEAEEYLSGTTGNYHEYAVRYKEYPEIEPTKTMQELKRRRAEYCARIGALDAPHYAGVKQATVKCKNCGSSLATQFCGKTYMNFCPVCRADLRPESMLEKRAGFEKTIKEIDAKLKAETKKLNAKQESKTKLYWMVCCEVHC